MIATAPTPTPQTIERTHYPITVIPEPVAGSARAIYRAIGCDPSMPALSILTTCAGCIGNSLTAHIKPGWSEPSVLWSAVIARSGGSKTPVLRATTRQLHRLQGEALERYKLAKADHENRQAIYELDLAEWRNNRHRGGQTQPEAPAPPVADRYLIEDATTEAIIDQLDKQKRGIISIVDELAGMLRGFNAYRGGKGGDAQKWLSMHNAQPVMVDRKKADPIYIPRAAVSLLGGIQPKVFASTVAGENTDNGLLARLLLTMPDAKPKRWTDAGIDPSVDEALQRLYAGLLAIPMVADECGVLRPRMVKLDDKAKRAFVDFYDEHAEATEAADDDLAAAYTKLEAYAARFALVFHAIKAVTDNLDPAKFTIDAETMACAIQLTQWHRDETARVYTLMSETDDARRHRSLVEYIKNKMSAPGTITPRDLQRCRKTKYPSSERAEYALLELEKAGYGKLTHTKPGEAGGRPSTTFTLFEKYMPT